MQSLREIQNVPTHSRKLLSRGFRAPHAHCLKISSGVCVCIGSPPSSATSGVPDCWLIFHTANDVLSRTGGATASGGGEGGLQAPLPQTTTHPSECFVFITALSMDTYRCWCGVGQHCRLQTAAMSCNSALCCTHCNTGIVPARCIRRPSVDPRVHQHGVDARPPVPGHVVGR